MTKKKIQLVSLCVFIILHLVIGTADLYEYRENRGNYGFRIDLRPQTHSRINLLPSISSRSNENNTQASSNHISRESEDFCFNMFYVSIGILTKIKNKSEYSYSISIDF